MDQLRPYGGSNFTAELILDDVIIDAVPEPGTLALIAAGLSGLAVATRKRRAPIG